MLLIIPPFDLGQTYRGTDLNDSSVLINAPWLGQVFEFPYETRTTGSVRGNKTRKSGRTIKAIAIRNSSGISLLPKRIVQLDTTAGVAGMQVTKGYANSWAQDNIAIVDDSLPSTGVADKDIFWAIVQGPVLTLAPMVGADFNGTDIVLGARLIAATGVTSQATSAGRITNITFTNVTRGVFNCAVNLVGTALSARTTGESTGAQDLLINSQIRY